MIFINLFFVSSTSISILVLKYYDNLWEVEWITLSTTENYLFIGIKTAFNQYFNNENVHGLISNPNILS